MILNDNFCMENIPYSSLVSQLFQIAKQEGIPLSGTFELTPRCNFNCRMCYVHLKPNELEKFGTEIPAEEWIRIAEEARDAGMISLCITGGEPLLYPEFETVYRAVAQMGFEIILQTNASLISENILNLLDEFPPSMIKSTIYGSNNRVYRDVCGVENGFSDFDAGIRALKNLKIPIVLLTTVIRQNKEDLPNIDRYARKMKIPWTYTASVYPSVRGAQFDPDSFLRKDDYTDFHSDFRRMLELPPRKPDDKPCDYCRRYRTGFWITWNGEMRFCSYMDEPHIAVKNRPFRASWKELVDYEDCLQWPKECRECEFKNYCRICAGTLSSQSGSVSKTDPDFCNTMREYFEIERKNQYGR